MTTPAGALRFVFALLVDGWLNIAMISLAHMRGPGRSVFAPLWGAARLRSKRPERDLTGNVRFRAKCQRPGMANLGREADLGGARTKRPLLAQSGPSEATL